MALFEENPLTQGHKI